MMKPVGLLLIAAGIVLILAGAAFVLGDRIPWLGRLPGDIHIHGRNSSFSFPIVTCLLISAILTAVINVVLKLLNR